MKRTIIAALLVLATVTVSASPGSCSENIYYSILFPGWGQMKDCRYTRGTLFMSAEIILLTGVLMSNIQYDRDVDQYEDAEISFRNATYIEDKLYYHGQMMDRWEDADNMNTYRKLLAGAAIGVWVVNIADMVWGDDQNADMVSLDVREDGFLVTKSFSF